MMDRKIIHIKPHFEVKIATSATIRGNYEQMMDRKMIPIKVCFEVKEKKRNFTSVVHAMPYLVTKLRSEVYRI